MSKIKIGWIGYSGGVPYWENTTDGYTPLGDKDKMKTTVLFKSKKEAKKRFEDARKVYVKAD